MGACTWDNRLSRAFADKGCSELESNSLGFALFVIPKDHCLFSCFSTSQYEGLSVNQAEMLRWHDSCSQRLNSIGK